MCPPTCVLQDVSSKMCPKKTNLQTSVLQFTNKCPPTSVLQHVSSKMCPPRCDLKKRIYKQVSSNKCPSTCKVIKSVTFLLLRLVGSLNVSSNCVLQKCPQTYVPKLHPGSLIINTIIPSLNKGLNQRQHFKNLMTMKKKIMKIMKLR